MSGSALKSLRPGYFKRYLSTKPSFMRDKFEPMKQKMREDTAEKFAARIAKVSEPCIFVLPYYYALCAAAIDRRIPQAKFFGVDRDKRVVDNVSKLDSGKTIDMYAMTVDTYMRRMWGKIQFDAAYLDYTGKCTPQRANEITEFSEKMMKPRSVVAVTLQHEDADGLGAELTQNLQSVIRTVKLVKTGVYATRRPMAHYIFNLDR